MAWGERNALQKQIRESKLEVLESNAILQTIFIGELSELKSITNPERRNVDPEILIDETRQLIEKAEQSVREGIKISAKANALFQPKPNAVVAGIVAGTLAQLTLLAFLGSFLSVAIDGI